MLKGKRTVLRPIRRSDLGNMLKWYNDPDVIQYLSLYLPMTEIGEEKWLENICTKRKDTDVVFMIEAIRGRKKIPIGSCGLHRINWKDRDAEFGIAIGEKKFWSNGYGTEAAELIIGYGFDQLNMHRISSGAYGFNGRSIKMHLKLGFKKEGVIRKGIFKNGKYQDKVLFGILKGERKKQKEKNYEI